MHVSQRRRLTESTLAANVRGTHHLLTALEQTGESARVLIPSSALVYAPAAEAPDGGRSTFSVER